MSVCTAIMRDLQDMPFMYYGILAMICVFKIRTEVGHESKQYLFLRFTTG